MVMGMEITERYGEPVCVPLVDQFVHSMASFGAHVHTALK